MGEFEASVHRRLEEAWGGVNWGGPGSGLEQWNARCCRVESWNRDCSGGHACTNRGAAPWVAADKGRRQAGYRGCAKCCAGALREMRAPIGGS